jgi:hypothetical protein
MICSPLADVQGFVQRKDEAGVASGPSIFFLQLSRYGWRMLAWFTGGCPKGQLWGRKISVTGIQYQDQKNEECFSDFPIDHVGRYF